MEPIPALGIPADEPIRVVPDELPECDQRLADIAHLETPDLDIAAEQFVEDGPAAEEWLVVGGNFAGKLGDDLTCLPTLAACPLDQDVLEVWAVVVGHSGTEIIGGAWDWEIHIHRAVILIFRLSGLWQ